MNHKIMVEVSARHIHLTPKVASNLEIHQNDIIKIKITTKREV